MPPVPVQNHLEPADRCLEETLNGEFGFPDGHTIAVEVERSVKTPQRRSSICSGLARTYDGIWYCCPKTLEEPLRQSFAQLDGAARRKCLLVPLPREQAAAAGQPATPPPPIGDVPGRDGGREGERSARG